MGRTPEPWFWEDRNAWMATVAGKRHRLREGSPNAAAWKQLRALAAMADEMTDQGDDTPQRHRRDYPGRHLGAECQCRQTFCSNNLNWAWMRETILRSCSNSL
jgi:hypothetical protein